MSHATSHSDTFVIDNLPPIEQLPQRDFSVVPELNYPERLNCAIELLDRALDIAGDIAGADRVLFYATDRNWTYGEMLSRVNRIAHVLTAELGLEPGNRVLLRGPNTPEMAAVWFAVVKAGGICVTTMPLLRRVELEYVINKAKISHALCDSRWTEEFVDAASNAGLERWMEFNGDSANGLDRRCEAQPDAFDGIDTHAEDPVLIGFTSGTTGTAKATIHTHRDVMAICDCFPRYVLKPGADDIFTGTPPFGFTFGLGA